MSKGVTCSHSLSECYKASLSGSFTVWPLLVVCRFLPGETLRGRRLVIQEPALVQLVSHILEEASVADMVALSSFSTDELSLPSF